MKTPHSVAGPLREMLEPEVACNCNPGSREATHSQLYMRGVSRLCRITDWAVGGAILPITDYLI
jgi:hypothetical protein